MHFKLMVLELALQHVEEDFTVVLHRAYKFHSDKYKGERPTPQMTEEGIRREKEAAAAAAKQKKGAKGVKKEKKEIILPFGASSAGVEQDKPEISELLLSKNVPSKKPLIQEVSSTPSPQAPTTTTTTSRTSLVQDMTIPSASASSSLSSAAASESASTVRPKFTITSKVQSSS